MESGGERLGAQRVEEGVDSNRGESSVHGSAFIHPSALIEEGAVIGPNSRVWHWVHVCAGARVGALCVLGQNVYIAGSVQLGSGCKVQNNVSIYEGVILEDDVFVGPSAVFTNVLTPRAHVSRREQFCATMVERGATIGANATIVCGIKLGRYCMIGAGSVVTRDVEAHALVVGNPARQVGWVCECGEKLASIEDVPQLCGIKSKELRCGRCRHINRLA